MNGRHRYRLVLIPKDETTTDATDEISPEELRIFTSKLSDHQIAIWDIGWLTRFKIHQRMVKHFQKDRVFLAGDAAHIHSPAGGQGMNIGIQDALNLAFKISVCRWPARCSAEPISLSAWRFWITVRRPRFFEE
jgi:3-(3-hydroxy-phenyl)propionate hydroxylase